MFSDKAPCQHPSNCGRQTGTQYDLWVKSAGPNTKRPEERQRLSLYFSLSATFHLSPFLNSESTLRIKEELVSIKYQCICQTVKQRLHVFKSPGLPLLLGKSGGDDLFLSSCYHDGETLTDLQIPQGVIFLTASNSVFFFLNITYCSNKKQVWGWNTTLTHHHISPLSLWCVI